MRGDEDEELQEFGRYVLDSLQKGDTAASRRIKAIERRVDGGVADVQRDGSLLAAQDARLAQLASQLASSQQAIQRLTQQLTEKDAALAARPTIKKKTHGGASGGAANKRPKEDTKCEICTKTAADIYKETPAGIKGTAFRPRETKVGRQHYRNIEYLKATDNAAALVEGKKPALYLTKDAVMAAGKPRATTPGQPDTNPYVCLNCYGEYLAGLK